MRHGNRIDTKRSSMSFDAKPARKTAPALFWHLWAQALRSSCCVDDDAAGFRSDECLPGLTGSSGSTVTVPERFFRKIGLYGSSLCWNWRYATEPSIDPPCNICAAVIAVFWLFPLASIKGIV